MTDYYIGLMSGTSADGIDAVLVDFHQGQRVETIASHSQTYPPALQQQITAFTEPGPNELDRLGELDIILGQAFADAVNTLLEKANIDRQDIKAIGSHGQTLRHRPGYTHPFTLQVGDPNTIAALTGITTIADFRRRDMALGGQGAPLAPAFHQYIFRSTQHNRVILNIGGIANITCLPKDTSQAAIGYDTGPGNGLMDNWINAQQGLRYDKQGAWASSGNVIKPLLTALLNDPYFTQPHPKSTGREYFNLHWLNPQLKTDYLAEDVQATLLALTASSITTAVKKHFSDGEIIVCGGGVHNTALLHQLQTYAPNFTVSSSAQHGVDPDMLEAILFAWLAKQTFTRQPGNLPEVTGAKSSTTLGGVYYAQQCDA